MTAQTELKRIYQKNQTAQALLDHLAERSRSRQTLTFDRAMAAVKAEGGANVTRAGLRNVFRQLERLGYGRYLVGRRGYKTRFVWNTDLVEVGKMAQGKAA